MTTWLQVKMNHKWCLVDVVVRTSKIILSKQRYEKNDLSLKSWIKLTYRIISCYHNLWKYGEKITSSMASMGCFKNSPSEPSRTMAASRFLSSCRDLQAVSPYHSYTVLGWWNQVFLPGFFGKAQMGVEPKIGGKPSKWMVYKGKPY